VNANRPPWEGMNKKHSKRRARRPPACRARRLRQFSRFTLMTARIQGWMQHWKW